MTQRGLFGGEELPAHCRSRSDVVAPSPQQTKIARRRDPQTSHQAAAEIAPDLGTTQRLFLEALRALGQPSTATEIAQRASGLSDSRMQESYRKRAAELVSAGRIGIAGKRRCRVTNRYASLYELLAAK